MTAAGPHSLRPRLELVAQVSLSRLYLSVTLCVRAAGGSLSLILPDSLSLSLSLSFLVSLTESLLALSISLTHTLVTQDEPMFFEELWVPGWAGLNYHHCFLKGVSPPVSSVAQLLRDNAFAVANMGGGAEDGAAGTGKLSAELRAMVPSLSLKLSLSLSLVLALSRSRW